SGTGGTYTVTVQGRDGTSTGTYDFRFVDIDAAAVPLTLGATVAPPTGVGRQAGIYRFEGTPGEELVLSDLEVPAPGTGLDYTYMLFSPSRTQTGNLPFNPETLTERGTYVLVVDTRSAPTADTPPYRFQLLNVASAPLIGPDMPQSGSLAAPGQHDV